MKKIAAGLIEDGKKDNDHFIAIDELLSTQLKVVSEIDDGPYPDENGRSPEFIVTKLGDMISRTRARLDKCAKEAEVHASHLLDCDREARLRQECKFEAKSV